MRTAGYYCVRIYYSAIYCRQNPADIKTAVSHKNKKPLKKAALVHPARFELVPFRVGV